ADRLLVDRGAGLEQRLDGLGFALTRRQVQRGHAAPVANQFGKVVLPLDPRLGVGIVTPSPLALHRFGRAATPAPGALRRLLLLQLREPLLLFLVEGGEV